MSWNPFHPAVAVTRDAASGRPSLVRHEAYPYGEDWTESDGVAGLLAIAGRYLKLANTRLEMPQVWLRDLLQPGTAHRVQLRWFSGRNDPGDSFTFGRYAGLAKPTRPAPANPLDRSAVLVAGLCVPSKKESDGLYRLYGGQGLRVIAHLGATSGGRTAIRITGVGSTLPPLPGKSKSARILPSLLRRDVEALAATVRGQLAASLGLESDYIVSLGFRLPDRTGALPMVIAKTSPDPDSALPSARRPYALVARLVGRRPGRASLVDDLRKRLLVAFANVDAMVYVRDPISKNGAAGFSTFRPRQPSVVLDPEREKVSLGDLPPGGTAGTVQLVDPDPNGNPDFQVNNSVLVDYPLPEDRPKELATPLDHHVRSDAFAATNAFHHVADLFERLRRYGLPPADYFRFATRPIDVRYRAGITPGAGDGRTVNAQVGWSQPPTESSAGSLEVRLALGDLQSATGHLPNNLAAAIERAPLGVAADPRWCWHECSHVLIAAATGELEFGFAHSAGDALAAILCDPDSKLACDRAGAAANAGGWRGVTYPWVQIPRRHDRDVQRGWGWTGPMNPVSGGHGYWSEQILSSSLFRLYRAIGGDCQQVAGGLQVPERQARRGAAEYSAYLIMRAILSLGPASVTPASDVHVFVDALKKADAGTAGAPGPGGYVGGSVSKVVQWAFERQGLYGVPQPGSPVSGAEEAATIDLHIEDLRAKPDGPYSPVDLLGNAWHGQPASLKLQKDPPVAGVRNGIQIKVENRGSQKARNVQVEVWVAQTTAAGIPAFPHAAWQSLGIRKKDVQSATGSATGKATLGPFAWTPAAANQQYAILATATCDADRANTDPASGLPCAFQAGPVHLLVACDNNLGLRLVKT